MWTASKAVNSPLMDYKKPTNRKDFTYKLPLDIENLSTNNFLINTGKIYQVKFELLNPAFESFLKEDESIIFGTSIDGIEDYQEVSFFTGLENSNTFYYSNRSFLLSKPADLYINSNNSLNTFIFLSALVSNISTYFNIKKYIEHENVVSFKLNDEYVSKEFLENNEFDESDVVQIQYRFSLNTGSVSVFIYRLIIKSYSVILLDVEDILSSTHKIKYGSSEYTTIFNFEHLQNNTALIGDSYILLLNDG